MPWPFPESFAGRCRASSPLVYPARAGDETKIGGKNRGADIARAPMRRLLLGLTLVLTATAQSLPACGTPTELALLAATH
jgi:hypothetical protein